MSSTAPVEERFSRRQVLRIVKISERQLSAWERQGFVQPSATLPTKINRSEEGNFRYSFSDLVTMKKLRQLRQSGILPSRIRSLYAALKARLPKMGNPWTELQVHADGKRLAVHFQGTIMEPLTGQLLLEYAPQKAQGNIRPLKQTRPLRRSVEPAWVRAERLFQAGLRYEEHQDTLPKAIRAYQKAIELNPHAVGPHINLGTIYYKLRLLEEAENCYRAALAADPGYALVYFNLGNVYDENDQWEEARRHYEQAIRLDSNYPDPHYNLALLYEKLGLHGKARQQWVTYVKLDPYSQWAATARQQIEKTSLQVLVPQKNLPAQTRNQNRS
ncbi:MAG: tetratricopeptide repeat protein [Acidobacteria bacterium]|nr:tetratricopeptide repeat protein [Acidobacteriota bacterium]